MWKDSWVYGVFSKSGLVAIQYPPWTLLVHHASWAHWSCYLSVEAQRGVQECSGVRTAIGGSQLQQQEALYLLRQLFNHCQTVFLPWTALWFIHDNNTEIFIKSRPLKQKLSLAHSTKVKYKLHTSWDASSGKQQWLGLLQAATIQITRSWTGKTYFTHNTHKHKWHMHTHRDTIQ